MSNTLRILVLSTLGSGSNEEHRICELFSGFKPDLFPFDRKRKFKMMRELFRTIIRGSYDLVAMEGTGLAGGVPLMLLRLLKGTKYIVSSGDAVGPWVASRYRILGPVFAVYERLLCRLCAGFIGWTPYLVGRALTFGAPRGMTAAGWAPFHRTEMEMSEARSRIRHSLNIPSDAIVIGIAGSLVWSRRMSYSYGLEIVEAVRRLKRRDVYGVIVGDGTGLSWLRSIGKDFHEHLRFTGRVPQSEVPDYLAAMDLGSLPQSVDGVGSFRYTTKISEYLDARLPMVTGGIPLSYDLDEGWILRLLGDTPWGEEYINSLVDLLEHITREDISYLRSLIPTNPLAFNKDLQTARVTHFVKDLIKLKEPSLSPPVTTS
jgi:Glycosyl transferases group 1